ncbi:MAG: TetR family transcriptional regulator [SAR86 cluster bacterium]|uniref:TetR family transcriptional regulator n=1 Tax=SAR86 cluster bacterium TaxID=2030880 RepID=A0A2A5AZA3_9GAMM|nr:MAG: TetR family transcriptional regulator [SAR86 cluster bacterium]
MNKKNVKRRNAEATRKAILESARKRFALAGYDGAGLREIAAGADVTAMMVNRYFGSKEQLFAEVLDHVMEKPFILTPEALGSPNLARSTASALVAITNKQEEPLDGFSVMLHSASNKKAAQIARLKVEQGRQKSLSDALQGPLAAERAAILLSIVAGVQVMRQTIGITPLAEADPDDLVNLLTPVFDKLING